MVIKFILIFNILKICLCNLTKIDASLSHHESVIFEDQLYIFGGNFSSGSYQVTPVKLNLMESTTLPPTYWNTVTDDLNKLQVPGLTGHMLALDQTMGKLYLVGGRTFDFDKRVGRNPEQEKIQFWVYDFSSANWENLSLRGQTILPPARHFHSLTFNHGKLYLFGGRKLDDSDTFDDFYVYHIDTNVWDQVSFSDKKACPTARSEHTATLISGNKILILGGKERHKLADINAIYSISTENYHCSKRIAKAENAPSNRFAFTATGYQSNILMVGGMDKDLTLRSEIYSLNIEKMDWTLKDIKGLVPRAYHSAASYGQALFLLYGTPNHPDSSVQIFKTDTMELFEKFHPDMRNEGSITNHNTIIIISVVAGCLLILLILLILWLRYGKTRYLKKPPQPPPSSSKFLGNSIFKLKNNQQSHPTETMSPSGKFTSNLWSDNYVDSSQKSKDHNISLPISNIEMKMHIDDITLQALNSAPSP